MPNKYKYINKHTKPNNFINNNNNYYNNNFNIYNLLLKTAALQINTVLYTTLKALSFSTPTTHHHIQQPDTTTTPTPLNKITNNKLSLLSPPPNLRWCIMHLHTSHFPVYTFQAHLTKIFELD